MLRTPNISTTIEKTNIFQTIQQNEVSKTPLLTSLTHTKPAKKPLFSGGLRTPIFVEQQIKSNPLQKTFLNNITNFGNAISGASSSISSGIDQIADSVNNIKPTVNFGLDPKVMKIGIIILGLFIFRKPLMRLLGIK
jgi:hypothetical protein